jgi:hypothetical protein
MAKLSDEIWLEIKTKYEMGYGQRTLCRDYDLVLGTLQNRIKKENWSQKLVTQVSDIKQSLDEISQLTNSDQIPIIHGEINDMLALQKEVNTFVKSAVKLNTMNLNAVINEPDHEKRINMTARMKATMPDLAGIAQTRLQVPEEDVDKEDNSMIKIYIPDNRRG